MPRNLRIGLWIAMSAMGGAILTLALARYSTFHNETFDLAFYARMAWGLSGANVWDPIVNANVLGLHLSPVLIPLGILGRLFGTAEVLLVAQAAAVAATAWPLALLGYRRLGTAGALLGACAYLLFPHIGHVASYEFHPGTLGALPLSWALVAIDRRSARGLKFAVLAVLACREDMALLTALIGLLAMRTPELRRMGRAVFGVSVFWALLFTLVLHPLFAPAAGSMQLHFGKWGDSAPEVLWSLVTRPGELLAHLGARDRLLYLPMLLAPLAFLPLLRPKWLVPALPILAMNLLSEWPTATDLDSHYQTSLLPFLVAAALDGAAFVHQKFASRLLLSVPLVTLIVAHLAAGGLPFSADFDAEPFTPDPRTGAAARVVGRVAKGASVQAPYELLPHLAEREVLARPPPPQRNTEYVILDLSHRDRYAHREELIRTDEEPVVRSWLARKDYGVIHPDPPYMLLARGADTRILAAARYLEGKGDPLTGRSLTPCLAIRAADIGPLGLVLHFVARGPCPSDLAIRLGTAKKPRRVDLLFDGVLSPARLEEGDLIKSIHRLTPEERDVWAHGPVRIGALRSGGTRPEHEDPVSLDVWP